MFTTFPFILDPNGSNKCKGYGFVDFESAACAELAVKELNKKNIPAQMAKQQEQDPTNLYFSALPPELSEANLEEILFQFGTVISTRILRDTDNSSKGVGFARMENSTVCDKIINHFNKNLFRQAIQLLVDNFEKNGYKNISNNYTRKTREREKEKLELFIRNNPNTPIPDHLQLSQNEPTTLETTSSTSPPSSTNHTVGAENNTESKISLAKILTSCSNLNEMVICKLADGGSKRKNTAKNGTNFDNEKCNLGNMRPNHNFFNDFGNHNNGNHHSNHHGNHRDFGNHHQNHHRSRSNQLHHNNQMSNQNHPNNINFPSGIITHNSHNPHLNSTLYTPNNSIILNDSLRNSNNSIISNINLASTISAATPILNGQAALNAIQQHEQHRQRQNNFNNQNNHNFSSQLNNNLGLNPTTSKNTIHGLPIIESVTDISTAPIHSTPILPASTTLNLNTQISQVSNLNNSTNSSGVSGSVSNTNSQSIPPNDSQNLLNGMSSNDSQTSSSVNDNLNQVSPSNTSVSKMDVKNDQNLQVTANAKNNTPSASVMSECLTIQTPAIAGANTAATVLQTNNTPQVNTFNTLQQTALRMTPTLHTFTQPTYMVDNNTGLLTSVPMIQTNNTAIINNNPNGINHINTINNNININNLQSNISNYPNNSYQIFIPNPATNPQSTMQTNTSATLFHQSSTPVGQPSTATVAALTATSMAAASSCNTLFDTANFSASNSVLNSLATSTNPAFNTSNLLIANDGSLKNNPIHTAKSFDDSSYLTYWFYF